MMNLHEGKTGAYEFDAPSHIIDFGSLEDADDNADSWFDLAANAAGLITSLRTPRSHLADSAENTSLGLWSRIRGDESARDPASQNLLSNIVTSRGNAGPSTSNQNQRNGPSCQPRRVPKRLAVKHPNTMKMPAAQPGTPPTKKPRRSAEARTPRRSGLAGGPWNRRRNTKLKSSEQQEVERMQALQKELAAKRKSNEATFKAAVTGSHPAKKLVLSTTVPVEFHFISDERLCGDVPLDYKEVDFISLLRKLQTAPANGSRGATVPKPFNLSGPVKRKRVEAEPCVSMAEQVEQFQKHTPACYRLHSRQSDEMGPSPVKNEKLKITHPQMAHLMKRPKSRPVAVKSSAEAEEEELEKIRQFKFKALELNRKILEAAVIPKKPAPKEPTQPQAFNLRTDRRIQERQATRQPEEPQEPAFHSRPIPAHILEDVVGVPQTKVQRLTAPKSPAFPLKNRVRVEQKVELEKLPLLPTLPYTGLPFQPKLPEKNQMELCPFSFDVREQERMVLKEKRLEELRNEEIPKFKAQPLPDFSQVHLPAKKVAVPTRVEPFQLLIDQRGTAKSEHWLKQMKEELKQQHDAAVFKARPNTVVYKEPFLPKKECRSIRDRRY